MRHCVLARIAPAPRAEPEPQPRVAAEHSEAIAAREWLVRRLRWDAQLAGLHARAGVPTYQWMWKCRAVHWTAY